MRACAELLRLPPLAIATGLLFLHRFRAACPDAGGIDNNVILSLTPPPPLSPGASPCHRLGHDVACSLRLAS